MVTVINVSPADSIRLNKMSTKMNITKTLEVSLNETFKQKDEEKKKKTNLLSFETIAGCLEFSCGVL